MTALCGGGTSGPRAGLPTALVQLGVPEVAAFIELLGYNSWASAIALLIAPLNYELNTLCGTDPPADPNLTAQDLIDALNFLDLATSIVAIDRIRQWFEHRYWYQVCQCTSTTTPTAPTPSDPGQIGTGTGLPSGGSSAPCWDVTDAFSVLPNGSTNGHPQPQLLPASASTLSVSATGWTGTFTATAVPAGVTQVTHTIGVTQADHFTCDLYLVTWTSTGTEIGPTALFTSPPIQHGTITANVPSNAAYWLILEDVNGSSANPADWNVHLKFFCSASPPNSIVQDCCPPDPGVSNKLAQIYATLNAIYQSLPAPLTSYAENTVHAGLSGNGQVAIAATALAVKLVLTTIPSSYGQVAEDPVFYFDVGYVTPAGVEGAYSTTRVTKATEVMVLPPLTNAFHYSLAPGVVATATELTRGP